VLAEAIALGRERNEQAWEPELLRQKGEVLAADPVGDLDEAERLFREAIERSRGLSMRSWQLRAAMSLGRLLVRLGRRHEARDVVVEAYRPFSEGFDTPDLLDARVFLDEMAA
jgi:predicted ATPase